MAQNITSPQIRCVSVMPNGNISVTWETPPDPLHQFSSYQIYTSTTKISEFIHRKAELLIIIQTVTPVQGITNANTQPYFVYIQTVTTSSFTLQSIDTVRTIFLIVSGVNPSSTPKLNWNSIASPLPAGEGTSYDIYRQQTLASNSMEKNCNRTSKF